MNWAMKWGPLLVFVAATLFGLAHIFAGPSYAQTGPSLEERQVQALETIAREMSRMRREKCR
jgi:hypothetical protein